MEDYNQEVPEEKVRQEKALLMLHDSESIGSVYIRVWSDDDVRMSSVYELRHPSEVNPAISAHSGSDANEPRMGAVEGGVCGTCQQEWERCPGHFGHIELGEMMIRPHYAKKIGKVFSCICKRCSRLMVQVSTTASAITGVSVVEEAYENAKKVSMCPHCNHPNYSWAKDRNLVYKVANPLVDKKKLSDWELFSEMYVVESSVKEKDRDDTHYHWVSTQVVLMTLLNIPEEDRRSMGVHGIDFQDMFFSVMPVLPNGLRPQRDLGGMITQHMFTKYFEKLVEESHIMRVKLRDSLLSRDEHALQQKKYLQVRTPVTSVEDRARYESEVRDLEARVKSRMTTDEIQKKQLYILSRRTMYLRCMELMTSGGRQAFPEDMKFTHLIQKKEGNPIQLNALLKGKHGIIRDAILSKRVNFCARTVASPAPMESKNDEVWVPERFKDSLLMYETLSRSGPDSNLEHVEFFEQKGMVVYVTLMNELHLTEDDSFLRVTPDSDPWNMFGVRIPYRKVLSMVCRKYGSGRSVSDFLLDGDVIDRQILEGINYLLINRQPSIWKYSIGAFRVRWWSNATLGIPDTALKPFNGDFDGDEFNAWAIRDSRTEAEVVQVLSASRNVLGEARNATAYGLHYDSLSGLFLMTRIIRRYFPIPLGEKFENIKRFIESVHGQYFDDVADHKTLDRVVSVSMEENQVVFSSEAIFPNFSPDQTLIRSLRDDVQMEELNIILRQYNIHPKSGRAYVSLFLPPDFYYSRGSGPDELRIIKGVVVKGTITKTVVGAFERDTFYPELTRKYGFQYVSDLMDNLVWLAKAYLTHGHSISFGLDDYGFLTNLSDKQRDEVDRAKVHVQGYGQLFNTLQRVAEREVNDENRKHIFQVLSEMNFGVKSMGSSKEARQLIASYLTEEDTTAKAKQWQKIIQATASFEERINGVHQEVFSRVKGLEKEKNEALRRNELHKAVQYESQIAQLLDSIRTEETKIIMSAVDPENAFIQSHGKGGEIFEVMGSVGQQFLGGARHEINPMNNRILVSHLPGDLDPTSRGMVEGNFTKGITPQEAYFIDHAARIGPVITKTQTAVIGDMGNRLTNAFQSIYVHDGACQDLTRESSTVVQFSVNGDNLASKYNMVRPGGSTHMTSRLPQDRIDHERKSNQTVINTHALQNELRDRYGSEESYGLVGDAATLTQIEGFLHTNIVNSFVNRNPTREKYVVTGLCRITTEKTRRNLIRGVLHRILSLEFPQRTPQNLQSSVDYVLTTALSTLTGYNVQQERQVIESTQVRQGDKIGALISGAVQQPIMQAAMDTFKKSGQTGSAVSVKDSFLRLTALTTNEQDYGFVNFVQPVITYREAYEKRMKVRSLTLNDVILNHSAQIHVRDDNRRANLPEYVKIYFRQLRSSSTSVEFTGENDADEVYWMELQLDGIKLRAHGIRGVDLAVLALQTNENARKGETQNNMIIFSMDESPNMAVVYSRKVVNSGDPTKSKDPRKDAAAFFMKSIYNRLGSIVLNDVLRGEENIRDAKPYAVRILDQITHVYREGPGTTLVYFDSRECRRLGVQAQDLAPALSKLQQGVEFVVESKTLVRLTHPPGFNPVRALKDEVAREQQEMEEAWTASVKSGNPREPEPREDGYIRLLVRYALMTEGNNPVYTFTNPSNNYRSSVVGDINKIVQYFGLRAARNFLAYELERLFDPDPKKPSGNIDYRHVTLMADAMVSTGKFGKLTYQGVDQMAGPNPLNQMGVGFNPTGAISKAAMTGTTASATSGFAVGIVSGKTSIPYERTQEALKEQASQKERINRNIALFKKCKPTNPVRNLSGTIPPAENRNMGLQVRQPSSATAYETSDDSNKLLLTGIATTRDFQTGDLSWYYDPQQTDLYRLD